MGSALRHLTIVTILLIVSAAPAARADDALSIIQENCLACHNPQKHKGGLVLTARELAIKGGEDGPVIQPGKSSASKMIELLAPGSDPHMPPKGQLTADEIESIKKWIDGGAVWPAGVVMTPSTQPATLRPMPHDYYTILAIALSPDGKKLAAGRGDRLLVFDITAKGKPIIAERQTENEPIFSVAWTSDGKLIATGGYRKIRVWDLESTGPKLTLEGFKGRVGAICFTPDNQTLIAADTEPATDASIYQFAVASGAPVKSWTAHADAIQSLKITTDGAQLITASSDKLKVHWDGFGQGTGHTRRPRRAGYGRRVECGWNETRHRRR
jgi:WD40 repeat protein